MKKFPQCNSTSLRKNSLNDLIPSKLIPLEENQYSQLTPFHTIRVHYSSGSRKLADPFDKFPSVSFTRCLEVGENQRAVSTVETVGKR